MDDGGPADSDALSDFLQLEGRLTTKNIDPSHRTGTFSGVWGLDKDDYHPATRTSERPGDRRDRRLTFADSILSEVAATRKSEGGSLMSKTTRRRRLDRPSSAPRKGHHSLAEPQTSTVGETTRSITRDASKSGPGTSSAVTVRPQSRAVSRGAGIAGAVRERSLQESLEDYRERNKQLQLALSQYEKENKDLKLTLAKSKADSKKLTAALENATVTMAYERNRRGNATQPPPPRSKGDYETQKKQIERLSETVRELEQAVKEKDLRLKEFSQSCGPERIAELETEAQTYLQEALRLRECLQQQQALSRPAAPNVPLPAHDSRPASRVESTLSRPAVGDSLGTSQARAPSRLSTGGGAGSMEVATEKAGGPAEPVGAVDVFGSIPNAELKLQVADALVAVHALREKRLHASGHPPLSRPGSRASAPARSQTPSVAATATATVTATVNGQTPVGEPSPATHGAGAGRLTPATDGAYAPLAPDEDPARLQAALKSLMEEHSRIYSLLWPTDKEFALQMRAARKIQAAVRGYFVRKYFRRKQDDRVAVQATCAKAAIQYDRKQQKGWCGDEDSDDGGVSVLVPVSQSGLELTGRRDVKQLRLKMARRVQRAFRAFVMRRDLVTTTTDVWVDGADVPYVFVLHPGGGKAQTLRVYLERVLGRGETKGRRIYNLNEMLEEIRFYGRMYAAMDSERLKLEKKRDRGERGLCERWLFEEHGRRVVNYAVAPFLLQVVPPRDWKPPDQYTIKPRRRLVLDRVFGCRGRDSAHALQFVPHTGEIVYAASTLAVLCEPATASQRFLGPPCPLPADAPPGSDPSDMGHCDAVRCVIVHPTHPFVFTGLDDDTGRICVWGLASGSASSPSVGGCMEVQFSMNVGAGVGILSISPCGNLLIAIAVDRQHTCQVWQWRSARLLATVPAYPYSGRVAACLFHPINSRQFFTCGTAHAKFWAMEEETSTKPPRGQAGPGTEAKRKMVLKSSTGPLGRAGGGHVLSACVVRDGRGDEMPYVTGHADGSIWRWSSSKNVVQKGKPTSVPLLALTFAVKPSRLVAADKLGHIYIWTASTAVATGYNTTGAARAQSADSALMIDVSCSPMVHIDIMKLLTPARLRAASFHLTDFVEKNVAIQGLVALPDFSLAVSTKCGEVLRVSPPLETRQDAMHDTENETGYSFVRTFPSSACDATNYTASVLTQSANSWRPVNASSVPSFAAQARAIDCVMDLDDLRFATTGEDCTLREFSLQNCSMIHCVELKGPARCLAYTPGGSQVAVGLEKGIVQVFHAGGPAMDPIHVSRKKDAAISAVRYTPVCQQEEEHLIAQLARQSGGVSGGWRDQERQRQGVILAALCEDCSVDILRLTPDLSQYKLVYCIELGLSLPPTRMDFSSDGKYIRVSSDAEVTMADVWRGQRVSSDDRLKTTLWHSHRCFLSYDTVGVCPLLRKQISPLDVTSCAFAPFPRKDISLMKDRREEKKGMLVVGDADGSLSLVHYPAPDASAGLRRQSFAHADAVADLCIASCKQNGKETGDVFVLSVGAVDWCVHVWKTARTNR
eukprot:Rmarinus@m.9740